MATGARTSKSLYWPELDALRFMAFFMVFSLHLPVGAHYPAVFAFSQAGKYGMSLFFLLSAYLITRLLLQEREKTGTVKAANFYARRMLRIWPLYFLCIAIGWAVGEVVPAYRLDTSSILYLLFLAANVLMLRRGEIGIIGPLWSLSIEEQFYAIVPFVAKRGGRRGLTIFAVVALVLAYLALIRIGLHTLHQPFAPWHRAWFDTLVQGQFFSAGMLLAVVLHVREYKPARWMRLAMFLFGCGSYFAAALISNDYPRLTNGMAPLLWLYASGLIGSTLVFLSIHQASFHVPKVIAYLGRISYGLYMFHNFVITGMYKKDGTDVSRFALLAPHPYVAALLCFAITVALASVSFHFFERPFLRLKNALPDLGSLWRRPHLRNRVRSLST